MKIPILRWKQRRYTVEVDIENLRDRADFRVPQGCNFPALLDLEIVNGSLATIDSRFRRRFTLKLNLSWTFDRILSFYLFSQVAWRPMMGDNGSRKALLAPGLTPRLRSRVVTTFLVLVLAACLTATILLLSRAVEESAPSGTGRSAQQSLSPTRSTRRWLPSITCLKGFQSPQPFSPMTSKASTTRSRPPPFRKEPGWYSKIWGEVFNTLRPFGVRELPKHSEFPNSGDLLKRVRERGWDGFRTPVRPRDRTQGGCRPQPEARWCGRRHETLHHDRAVRPAPVQNFWMITGCPIPG